MKILIVTEAWHPQINGVVRTLEAVKRELEHMGHTVVIVAPEECPLRTRCLRSYPEIKLEFFADKRLRDLIIEQSPDAIHLATEGPLGWAARRVCLKLKKPFTTCYHTRFPEYIAQRAPKILSRLATDIAYAILRRFHAPSSAVMVPTASMENELKRRKFKNIVLWARGIDTETFRPYGKDLAAYADLLRPILLYVGRVSVEKNLREFLALKTAGSKVVIGDGPDLLELKKQYPQARFLGILEGEALARHYAAANVFVFPSKTDTFGLVLLEACACGLRIASYPSSGPIDLFMNPDARAFAVLHTDLQKAVDGALRLEDNPDAPRKFAETHSWEKCTKQFLDYVILTKQASQASPEAVAFD